MRQTYEHADAWSVTSLQTVLFPSIFGRPTESKISQLILGLTMLHKLFDIVKLNV